MQVVVGFFGNLLVLYVFIFHYHECNFRYFVICLSFNDFLGSITTMPGEIVGQTYWYMYPSNVLCKAKSFFNMFTVVCEALCLLVIAVDRYRKVCQPIGWQIRFRHTKILCGCVMFVSFLIALPVPFLWGTHKEEKEFLNRTVVATVCEKDESMVNSEGPHTYVRFIQCILPTCIFSMLLLYSFIIYHIIKQRRNGQTKRFLNRGQSDSEEKEITKETNFNGHITQELSSTTDQDGIDSDVSTVTGSTSRDFSKGTDNLKEEKSDRTTDDETSGTSVNKRVRHSVRRTVLKVRSSSRQGKHIRMKAKRKTKIMFILILIFFITTLVYLVLLDYISRPDRTLEHLSNTERAVYFFFFRLVFINHIINPFVYGVLDAKFQNTILTCVLFCRRATTGKSVFSPQN